MSFNPKLLINASGDDLLINVSGDKLNISKSSLIGSGVLFSSVKTRTGLRSQVVVQ